MKHFFTSLVLLIVSIGAAQEAAVPLEVLGETASHRVVAHLLGETEVPLEPERIVALGFEARDALLALGVTPVAAASSLPESRDAYLEVTDFEPLPTWPTPNLEQLIALQPDLILAREGSHTELYDQLSRVAPTVVLREPWVDARATLLAVGDALGRRAEAEARVSEYDAFLEEVRGTFREVVGDTPVAMSVVFADNRVYFYGTSGNVGTFLHSDLGLTPDPLAPEGEGDFISTEALAGLSAGYWVLQVDESARPAYDALTELPFWTAIPAIQEGRVYPDETTWWALNTLLNNEHRARVMLGFFTGESD
jgi:iron complex transport system substrate-binding protein